MVEQIMFFTLGILCAGLVSISILPAFWRRAERLVRKELEEQLPLSPREIAAERDQLRAQYSLKQCMADKQVEDTRIARFEDQKQVGIHLLTISAKTEEATSLRGEIAALTTLAEERATHIEQLKAEIVSGENLLAENQKTLTYHIAEHLALETQHQTLNSLSNQRADEIIIHKTTINTLEMNLSDSKYAHGITQKALLDQNLLHSNLQESYKNLSNLADERRLEISNLSTALELACKRVDEQQITIAELRQSVQQKSREATNLVRDLTDAQTSILNKQNHLDAALELANRRQETIESKNDTLQFKSSALSDAGQQVAILRAELSAETVVRKRAEREALDFKNQLKFLEDNTHNITRQSQETARDLSRTIDLLRTENQLTAIQMKRSREAARLNEAVPLNEKTPKAPIQNTPDLNVAGGTSDK